MQETRLVANSNHADCESSRSEQCPQNSWLTKAACQQNVMLAAQCTTKRLPSTLPCTKAAKVRSVAANFLMRDAWERVCTRSTAQSVSRIPCSIQLTLPPVTISCSTLLSGKRVIQLRRLDLSWLLLSAYGQHACCMHGFAYIVS